MCAPYLGDDPVFGRHERPDDRRLPRARPPRRPARPRRRRARGPRARRRRRARARGGEPDVLVYADLARWEIQQRQRRHEIASLGVHDRQERPAKLYKRGFFVDWRAADRLKRTLLDRIDWLLDTNDPRAPKMIAGDDFRARPRRDGAAAVPRRALLRPRPLGRAVDEGGLRPARATRRTTRWCFDCVPEENSLLLGFGGDARRGAGARPRLPPPARAARRGRPRALRRRVPDPLRLPRHDGRRATSRSRCTRSPSTSRTASGCTTRRTRATTCSTPGEGACVYLGLQEGVDREAMVARPAPRAGRAASASRTSAT